MKKTIILLCTLAALLSAGAAQAASFTMPDTEALRNLISHPEQIGPMITTVSEEQAAMIIIQVITLMQAEGMDMAAIQQTVAILFQTTTEVRGARFGSAVVAIVRKKVNPRLLPIIRTGDAPLPPPGPSPRYRNQ